MGKISFKESIEIISLFMEMSEKGIRTLLTEFFSMLTEKEFVESIPYINEKLHISDLSSEKINLLPEDIIRDYFLNNVLYYHSTTRDLDYEYIKNFKESKYWELIKFLLEYNNFTVEKTKIDKIDFDKLNKNKVREIRPFEERDFIEESDCEEIKKREISCEELATYTDGWYDSLPFINLFSVYEEEEIISKMKTIVFNATFCRNKFDMYGNRYVMIGSILELLNEYKYQNVDWNIMFNDLMSFIYFSSNKKCFG